MEVINMSEFILSNLKGVKVTLAVTGLPIVITGEIMGNITGKIIDIKLENGSIVHVNSELIAFIF
jgi:hypothetical protein